MKRLMVGVALVFAVCSCSDGAQNTSEGSAGSGTAEDSALGSPYVADSMGTTGDTTGLNVGAAQPVDSTGNGGQ